MEKHYMFVPCVGCLFSPMIVPTCWPRSDLKYERKQIPRATNVTTVPDGLSQKPCATGSSLARYIARPGGITYVIPSAVLLIWKNAIKEPEKNQRKLAIPPQDHHNQSHYWREKLESTNGKNLTVGIHQNTKETCVLEGKSYKSQHGTGEKKTYLAQCTERDK